MFIFKPVSIELTSIENFRIQEKGTCLWSQDTKIVRKPSDRVEGDVPVQRIEKRLHILDWHCVRRSTLNRSRRLNVDQEDDCKPYCCEASHYSLSHADSLDPGQNHLNTFPKSYNFTSTGYRLPNQWSVS